MRRAEKRGKSLPPDAERSIGADDCKGTIPYTLKIRSGCEGGGKGALVQEDLSATLATNNDQYLFQPIGFDRYNQCSTGEVSETVRCPNGGDNYPTVCYGISSYDSNAMKSSNPHSGIYEADTARTLDLNGGNPACNQGGMAIVQGVMSLEPGIAAREGGHIYEGVSGTLRANAGDNQMSVCYGVDVYNQTITGDKAKTLNSAATDADHVPCAVYSVENHPADSRVNLDESGKVQTLTSRMGTGGGNVPMVMHPFRKSARGRFKGDAETWVDGNVANCLNTFDSGESRASELIVEEHPNTSYSINHQGGNVEQIIEEKTGTLTAAMNSSGNNKLSVAYGIDQGASRDVGDLFLKECSKTITNGSCPGHHNGVVIANPTYTASKASFFMHASEGPADTLVATDYKDPQLVAYPDNGSKYIVRRLTPTECARLQGFPDEWGHPIKKESLTDEEFAFWHEVRNTHERIMEKKVGTYTKEQILKWYNKLHNDGSEYKMWGNGIALPNALYVMRGVADALKNEKTARSKWLYDLLRS